ncbi:heat shock 70 kDa protein 12B-like [Crassostrea virginica]
MVDIAVYKQKEKGVLKEILLSTGVPFGGISVDRAFEAFLESIFGSNVLDIFKTSYYEDFCLIFEEFEVKKRDLGGMKLRISIPLSLESLLKKENGSTLSTSLEKSQYNGLVTLKNKTITLDPSLLNSFFQEAIDGIVRIMQDMLDNLLCADLEHIIMVGGFSGSEIIRKVLRETFPSYRFFLPDEPELAVLKGAVYFGHIPNAVSSRVARFTYGVNISRRFRPEEDPENKMIVIDKVPRCKNVFFPMKRRGDQIETDKEYSFVFNSFKQNQHIFIATIYVTDDKKPKYIDDEGCKALGSLTLNVLNDSEKDAEIEQTIIFGETNLIFRAKQCGADNCVATSFDLLDKASVPDLLHK